MTAPAFEKIWMKLYADVSLPVKLAAIKMEEFLPVFQKWIQEEKIPGIMIDAADYGHVQDGPGMLLVCFDEHFCVEVTNGRLGLLYQRKTAMEGSNQERLRHAASMLVRAATLLEHEPIFREKLKFRYDEFSVRLADRLSFSNSAETFEAVRGDLETFFANLFGRNVALEREKDDARELFSATARSLSPVDPAEIRNRLA